MKTSLVAILLLAFGIAGGIDQVPQLQQENERLREKVERLQMVACDAPAHVAKLEVK